MTPDIVAELAPTGALRAGINLSNFLLVTGKTSTGDPAGVAPDLAAEIAKRLNVPVKYMSFKTPGELADQAGRGVWDIGLIGAEPQRAETMAFTAAYAEIVATYLVPAGSQLKTVADVDAAGVRISVTGRSAYGLWLDRNIKHAALVRTLAAFAHIDVVYLPPYSPNLNLIERVWKFVKKEALANRSFADFTAFRAAIDATLAQLGARYKDRMMTLLSHRFETLEPASTSTV